MQILITCHSSRDDNDDLISDVSYTGPLPEYRRIVCTDPTLAVFAALREGCWLHRRQPSLIEASWYPLPNGEPWSRRGVELGPGPSGRGEGSYSAIAWLQRRPAARYQIRQYTMDAGFGIVWTFELLADDCHLLTAISSPGAGMEIVEKERIDQPVAFAPMSRDGIPTDAELGTLGFLRVSEWTTTTDDNESTASVIEIQR